MKAKAIIPQLMYYNTKNADGWLSSAFGFEKHMVITDETGKISHAELILSNDMIMTGSADYGVLVLITHGMLMHLIENMDKQVYKNE